MEPAHLARTEPTHPAVGLGLQEAPDSPRRIRLHGSRATALTPRASSQPAGVMTSQRRLTARIAIRLAVAMAFALAAAGATAADMGKVVRHVFPAAETGFDPQGISDLYSGTVIQAIFETLLTYDYLARPAKLVPMAAEAL